MQGLFQKAVPTKLDEMWRSTEPDLAELGGGEGRNPNILKQVFNTRHAGLVAQEGCEYPHFLPEQ